jgi:ABC-type xylose transport system substrate-binding protein
MVIGTANDGQEDWIVDLPLGNYYVYYGQGCRFATCAYASQWDQSDNKFSVVAGAPVEKINSSYPLNQSLVVLSPSGGETWSVGSSQTVKWSGGNATSIINILLVDDKQSYAYVASNSVNDGTEQWIIPSFIPSGQYKIYVACNNCGTAPAGFTGGFYNYSFYPFTIKIQ